MAENIQNTKRVTRHDIGTLDVLSSGDGFLRARVRFARAGVFPYVADGVTRYEAKLPEELFSVSTLDSAKRVPVTDGHPTELLSSKNYAQHIRGSLGDTIVVAEGFLEAEETVFDSALIEKIKSGEAAEISIGFTCVDDNTGGVYKGERYDSIQRDIKINHIAHVSRGRAGKDVRAYFDSANVPTTNLNFKKDESEEKTKGAKKMADENQQNQNQENTQDISEQKFFRQKMKRRKQNFFVSVL